MPAKARKAGTEANKTKREGKLSLHPMEFEDALAVLLNTPATQANEGTGSNEEACDEKESPAAVSHLFLMMLRLRLTTGFRSTNKSRWRLSSM